MRIETCFQLSSPHLKQLSPEKLFCMCNFLAVSIKLNGNSVLTAKESLCWEESLMNGYLYKSVKFKSD